MDVRKGAFFGFESGSRLSVDSGILVERDLKSPVSELEAPCGKLHSERVWKSSASEFELRIKTAAF